MSVTVMTAEDVRKSGARTVGELLEDVPGVQIQNDGSQGLKRVSIRGEDAFRTLVLIDGQKISEQKSMSGSPMLIDAARIERVEVIKGPASVLYGSDAIGGVVNIITKKGGREPVEGEVWTEFSGASRGFSEGMAVRGNLDGLKYSLSGSHSDQGNIHTPEGELSNTNFRQTDAAAFLSYDFSEHFTLGGGVDYYKGAFNSTALEYVRDPDLDFFVKVPKWTRTKYYVFAEGKDVSEYLSRVRLDAYYQKTEKNMENYIGNFYHAGDRVNYGGSSITMSNDGHVIIDNFADNVIRSKGVSLQTDWQLGADHFLVTGYELNYDRLNSVNRTYMDMVLPFRMGPMGERSMSGDYFTDKFYDGTQLQQSVLASMESQLPWNVALTYGVRWTHVRTSLDRSDGYKTGSLTPPMGAGSVWNGTPVDASDMPSTGDDANSRPVFNVGLVWTGIENLAVRASWAQGFRVPNLTEKYIGTAMGQSSGTTWGNPDLDPETSNNFEVGARYNDGGLGLDLAFFYSIADDYIATLPIAGTGDYRYANVAEAKTFGSELVASYRFATAYGEFTPYASLTWMRRQYDDGEGWKTYDSATPEWVSRYGVRYAKSLTDNLDFRADVYGRSQSATEYRSSTGSGDYDLGGFTTANVSFGFDFGAERQFSLLAEVLNIFDKRYQYNTAILEPGVHANVKLSYRF